MSPAAFVLSSFGDEIDQDLETQVRHLTGLNVYHLEFRSAWGTNVKDMTGDQLRQARAICDAHDMRVSCIGSPIGKSPIQDPLANELANLDRVFTACDALGTRHIRMFAFYPPERDNPATFDAYIDESAERLRQLADRAGAAGCTLVLENDLELVGDTLERTHALLAAVDSPHLRHAWDPGNFVLAGVDQPTTNGWPLLGRYVSYVHIKDATGADHTWRAAGEGDAQIPDLLHTLNDNGYRGMLAVEPHPFEVAGRGTFSGPEGTTYAVQALRKVMVATGCAEVRDLGEAD